MAGVLGRQAHAGVGDTEVPHTGLCPGGAGKGMTSALVAMVTGWSKEVSRRCAGPELDPDALTGLRLAFAVLTVVQSAHMRPQHMQDAVPSSR